MNFLPKHGFQNASTSCLHWFIFSGGDFGTMIIHGEDETDESCSGSQLTKEKESSSSQVDGASVGLSGEELASGSSWYFLCENPSGACPLKKQTGDYIA